MTAAGCNQFLRLAIRHPNGSGPGSEEEKMSTVHSVHLTLKAVRLLELCEAGGFENIESLLEGSAQALCPVGFTRRST